MCGDANSLLDCKWEFEAPRKGVPAGMIAHGTLVYNDISFPCRGRLSRNQTIQFLREFEHNIAHPEALPDGSQEVRIPAILTTRLRAGTFGEIRLHEACLTCEGAIATLNQIKEGGLSYG